VHRTDLSDPAQRVDAIDNEYGPALLALSSGAVGCSPIVSTAASRMAKPENPPHYQHRPPQPGKPFRRAVDQPHALTYHGSNQTQPAELASSHPAMDADQIATLYSTAKTHARATNRMFVATNQ
jgi:hypothetical protein